jgi:hypothetical protein
MSNNKQQPPYLLQQPQFSTPQQRMLSQPVVTPQAVNSQSQSIRSHQQVTSNSS